MSLNDGAPIIGREWWADVRLLHPIVMHEIRLLLEHFTDSPTHEEKLQAFKGSRHKWRDAARHVKDRWGISVLQDRIKEYSVASCPVGLSPPQHRRTVHPLTTPCAACAA